ncbi:MAG: 16S rRNA (cytosine(1402)-N(4))-methyltransferase RsmH [Candidatus Andersenbacteria bacterium]
MHVPVMPQEALHYLALQPGQVAVDGTFGAGGHTAQLLRAVGEHGKVIGIDRDPAAIDAGSHRFAAEVDAGRLVLVQARFAELANVLQELGQGPVDGVLLDLGVSTEQLLSTTRGFSFQHEAALDMRMDRAEDLTAARVLAEYDEQQLRALFFTIGERRYAGRLARAIVRRRAEQPIATTGQLVELVASVMPARERARRSTHLATRVFLALRIEVNHELEQIERGLGAAIHALRPGGRLVVITFHSLEDALVKQTFRRWSNPCVCPPEQPICTCRREPLCQILTKKPVPVSETEAVDNPRARSAKLRACERR